MKQQVNLFQPMFRQERRVFSAEAMVISLALVAAGLGLIYGFAQWSMAGLESEMAGLTAQQEAARKQIVGLEKQLPGRRKSKLLEAEVTRLQNAVAEKQAVMKAFAGGGLGNTAGFSGHLEGFARRRVDGVWLKSFHISASGKGLELSGAARRPDLVPALLQRLGKEKIFAGMQFRSLQITRAEGESQELAFALQTTVGGGK